MTGSVAAVVRAAATVVARRRGGQGAHPISPEALPPSGLRQRNSPPALGRVTLGEVVAVHAQRVETDVENEVHAL